MGGPGAARRDAEDRFQTDIRTGLVVAVFGLVAVGVGHTARTYRSTRREQTTDRYLKAVARLGSHESVAVRVGGVYALERLMTDSPEDQRTVVELLAAYVREQAPRQGNVTAQREAHAGPAPHVKAALTVLGRRTPLPQKRIDLSATDLRGADLRGAQLDRPGQGVMLPPAGDITETSAVPLVRIHLRKRWATPTPGRRRPPRSTSPRARSPGPGAGPGRRPG